MSCVENGNVYEFRDVDAKKDDYKAVATMGSVFLAVDTKKVYVFNADTKEWGEF